MNLFKSSETGFTHGWAKSRYCSTGSCLEITARSVWICDSKDLSSDRVLLEVTSEIWNQFCEAIASGDVTPSIEGLEAYQVVDTVILTDGTEKLVYTQAEWDAFVKSAAIGELRTRAERFELSA